MKTFFLSIIFCFVLNLATGQTNSQPTDSLDDLDNERGDKLYDESNATCNSFHVWPHRYRVRCYYTNGNKRRFGNCSFFRVLRSKTWDESGRLIRKSKQFPFTSTSYTYVSRQKTYNDKGTLIRYEYIKEHVSCFGGGIVRQKIIEYDDKGKVIRRVVKRKKDFEKGAVF